MSKKSNFWMIPGLFFLVAAALNLYGKMNMELLANYVKPALLPLLAVTTVAAAGGMEHRNVRLLVLAQLLGCTGDVFLLFNGFLPFVGGMAAFLLGHLCYITLFGGQSWKKMGLKVWIPALLVMGGAFFGLVKLIGIEGDLLIPMCVYGMVLMLLIFSGLCGLFRMRKGDGAWGMITLGALLFTFSDGLIAVGTFSEQPAAWIPVTIMATYLAAQALLAAGGLRLKDSR